MKTFPATQLKPYAEPVTAREAQPGRVYFALQYVEPDLLVPTLEPLIFLGWNLEGDDPDARFFQSFDSFVAGIRYRSRKEDDWQYFQAYGPNEGKHIFEYERALEALMACALRRREKKDLDNGSVSLLD